MAVVAATDGELCVGTVSVIKDTVFCFSVEMDSVTNSAVNGVGVVVVVSIITLFDLSVKGTLCVIVVECIVAVVALWGDDTDGTDSVICFGADDMIAVCIGFSTDGIVCADVRTDVVVIDTVFCVGDVLDFVATTLVLCPASEILGCVEVFVDSVSTDVVSVAVVVDGAVDTVVMKGVPCFGAEVRRTFIVDKLFSVVIAVDPKTANGELCGIMGSVVCFSVD